jgi:MFS family permease
MSAATLARAAVTRLDTALGGASRRRVVVVLAAVLALDSADKATVGTNATQLEAALHIGTAKIGLLMTVSSFVGAAAVLPAGALVDRVNRTRLLAGATLLWGVASALSGLTSSYNWLLVARLGLGAVVAVAGPATASLIGDYFPERERGRIYGFVISGELIGAGFGFVVAGQLAALSWRAPFFALVVPSLVVCWLVHRLPEPERGGADDAATGATVDESGCHQPPDDGIDSTDSVRNVMDEHHVRPRSAAVLDEDPGRMSVWQVLRYVLAVRTNVVLIVASALGYFFFSGMRGFAVQFVKHHYGLSQQAASSLTLLLGMGALGGVLSGGRLADRLLRGGRLSGRIEVPGVAVLLSALLFVPALIVSSIWAAAPLLVLAAVCLGAVNPPLDAARLDIIHAAAWGRAESLRTALRSTGDAAAPLLFGVLAQVAFGGSGGRGSGLRDTFLVMLIALVGAALLTLLVARRTYPADVAAAAESTRRLRERRLRH